MTVRRTGGSKWFRLVSTTDLSFAPIVLKERVAFADTTWEMRGPVGIRSSKRTALRPEPHRVTFRKRPEESEDERGERYVAGGRLTVRTLSQGLVHAECVGHRRIYSLGFNDRDGWWCQCGHPRGCAHVAALQLVVDPDLVRPAASRR